MGVVPVRSIAEEQERQRALNAAASSNVTQGMGATPAASSIAPAASALSPRHLLGRVSGWMRGVQSDASMELHHPTPQSRSDAPEPTVDDDEEGPDMNEVDCHWALSVMD